MSTGGIFQLITNEGKQDRMLMGTELLSQRLAEIRTARKDMENPDPTLADIERTHILFMNAHYKPFAAIAYEYNKVQSNTPTLGSKAQFSIPQFGDFFSDMVVHVKLHGATPTFSGTAVSVTGADCALFRWCDFPGERLFQKVSFDVNGNPLDEYFPDTYTMHRQFAVPANKKWGWYQCVGQEVPIEAKYKYYDTTTAPAAPNNCRAAFNYYDGFQTYKTDHEDLEMLIPLLFWFNSDPRLAIPSVAIPYGQRFINIDIATKAQLLRAIINPGALSTTGLTAPDVVTPTFTNFDLYINNIFVQPDIHDIFISRIGFTLIRVHRRQITNVNKSTDNILLQNLKWPIETMYVGIRPVANITPNTTNTAVAAQTSVADPNMSDWHKFGEITRAAHTTSEIVGAGAAFSIAKESGHVTSFTISAHGVPLYKDIPAKFFNSYVPYNYGGWNIATPTDPGLYMITFNLYPGTYQPSGHINVSRAREFYIQYTSTLVDSDATAELIVNAVALNFLLVSDGSATLRYAT
jgi:hypothetical protein